ncbi:hypothetical protein PFISCL1PPCAC_16711, partial [Pristionchus fissidentatus]
QDGLSLLFYELGFDVLTRQDLTQEMMGEAVKKFAASEEHQRSESAFVFFLCHGDSGLLQGIDGKFVNTSDIESLFDADRASHLAGKPKVIVYQSCRGGSSDVGMFCDSSRAGKREKNPKKIPTSGDLIVAYSTADSHVSKRTMDGTHYIQQLIQTTRECAHKLDLSGILNQTRQAVWKDCANENKQHLQAPEFHSRHDKRFFFFPPDAFLP